MAGLAASSDRTVTSGWVRSSASPPPSTTPPSPRTLRSWPRALPHIGHFQIRNRGTVGGSIAHADPASELPAVALALDATHRGGRARRSREIAAVDFFDSTWQTTLDENEVLTAVRFPVWDGASGFAVEEVARRHGDFAICAAQPAASRSTATP